MTSQDAADPLVRLGDEAVALAARWLDEAAERRTAAQRRVAARLHGVIDDADGVSFAMAFVDRVLRPEDRVVAAGQLAALVRDRPLPSFLSPIDRLLLRAGARLAPLVPRLVMPLAEARMRHLVGHLVVDADDDALAAHLGRRRGEGYRLNVNLLGEAVLGHREADRRLGAAIGLVSQPDVTYVSVKVSAVVAQLAPWAVEASVERVVERLVPLFDAAAATQPPTFVNLDMEEYHDLELTVAAFERILTRPGLESVDAGIVLQAYLPDATRALEQLVAFAATRPGGDVKIRLVKGANLAMEHVESAMRGWTPATYDTKKETDANYKRCLDWVMTPERMASVRIGVASHNLFDLAFARLLAQERGVSDRVEFEMLEGMAPAEGEVIRDEAGDLLLYTPVVDPADFDVAISYLFRRLEENASDENFIRHLFGMRAGSDAFVTEADRFRASLARRWSVADQPRRRPRTELSPPSSVDGFVNEPDTDPSVPENRRWLAAAVAAAAEAAPSTVMTTSTNDVDQVVATVADHRAAWAGRSPDDRREVLHAVADALSARRADLVGAMVNEARKTVAEADPEVSEAIDFARWYGDRAVELTSASARFEPLGTIVVVPPWNFPVAIPAGGVLAALAAGNTVVLKPAPETPRCAEIVAECCWEAGVPREVLAFVRTPDDEVGQHLVAHPSVDGVILTGSAETAGLFRSWRPERPLFAETSGKNALVITPNADLDLAVADLVASAFGHSGQKCSAASLAICVGDVFGSDRFRRQLVDAVTSLDIGPSPDPTTRLGPTILPPAGKLARALTELDAGEEWLVAPEQLGPALWRPGVRVGVRPGSWFHQTECFGPVLGIVAASDLDEAIRIQNATDFGLTGGLHSLDPHEIEEWTDRVEVGNAYVNRGTTGAIVARQPFGGWKGSTVGPGAKAGGPNYVAMLGRWVPTDGDLDDAAWLEAAERSDGGAWAREFGIDHDPVGLFCESNVFRYRPLPAMVIRVSDPDGDGHRSRAARLARVESAAARCGVPVEVSSVDDESDAAFAARVALLGVERIRMVGPVSSELREATVAAGVHLVDAEVTSDGRRELGHWLREQAVTRTLHRYGNLVG